MESSGTYGDVLRHQLLEHGVPVYRMSGKRTHDAAEVYDGVPSLHDAKSAAIIAKLHFDRVSTPWGPLSEEKRELKAAIATMDLYREQHQRLIHSLESSLARYWPELTEHLELSSATLVALLARVGGPHDVAGALDQARGLLHGMSHGLMSTETIEAVLQSAASSAGVRLLPQERVALMTLAAEAHRALKEFKKAKLAVERLSTSGAAQRLAPTTGKATAAVLIADAGDPRDYPSTRAYLKGYGLNLKEKSSGKQKGAAQHHQARSRPSAPVPVASGVSLAAEGRGGASLVRGENQTRRRATGTRGDSADAQVCAGAVSRRAWRAARLEQAV
jgi:transposase